MDPNEALKEATKRWGKSAAVDFKKKALPKAERDKLPKKDPRRLTTPCSVGKIVSIGGISFFSVEGSGDTFEEAFAEADRRREGLRAAGKARDRLDSFFFGR